MRDQLPLHEFVLPAGIRLVVLPQPHWLRTVVQVGLPFGGCNATLQRDNATLPVVTGSAHLLEHCVMNHVQRQLAPLLALDGTSIQAQTSWYRTSYSFWTSGDSGPVLSALLEALLGLEAIDPAMLVHEQAIVVREIQTTARSIQHIQRQQTLHGLFQQHPIRNGVLGDPTMVAQLDAAALFELYQWIYQPAALHIFIGGPVDGPALADRLAALTRQPGRIPQELPVHEPAAPAQARITAQAAVPQTLLRLAFKEQQINRSYAWREASSLLVMDLLAAALRQTTAIQGSHDYAGDRSAGYSVLSWSTARPEALLPSVQQALEQLRTISSARLALAVRQRIRQLLQLLEQPEQAINWLQSMDFKGVTLASYWDTLNTLTPVMLQERLEAHFQPANAATSLLTPGA